MKDDQVSIKIDVEGYGEVKVTAIPNGMREDEDKGVIVVTHDEDDWSIELYPEESKKLRNALKLAEKAVG